MSNHLWEKLLDPISLKAGWNLARNDSQADFIETPFYADAFSISFEQNIVNIIKRLKTGTYRPAPLNLIDVPKSTLAIRPRSVPEIEDRIVLQSIVRLLAPSADKCLSDCVYSYRLKKKPTPTSIFEESDALDLPYLKSKTISKFIDPFDPWYAAWPRFDERSRAAFLKDGYKFLVVTDIAAYFENIQLPLLRDLLLHIFPTEQKIINFVIQALEGWTISTDQGRNFHRGIPQGTQISSFLGNIFLLPLDGALINFCKKYNAKYFRYMDDVRLFTKEYSDARRGLLLMDKTIRSLHLNTQSAKTEIISESPNREITKRLIDPRLDEINFIIEKIREKKYKLTKKERALLFDKLRAIAKKAPISEREQKIFNAKKPLKGLSLRVFRRWLTAHAMLGGTEYLKLLIREIKRNPDHRLTHRLTTIMRANPKITQVTEPLFQFIQSDLNIFPHQWAEILRSYRYLSKIPPYIIEHCKKILLDSSQDPHVRSMAAMLLSRTNLEKKFLDKCFNAFRDSLESSVQTALMSLLMQSSGKYARSILHSVVFHPNDSVRKVGKLFREVRYDEKESRKRLKYIFEPKREWRQCDNMGLAFSVSCSDRPEILKVLIKYLEDAVKQCPRLDLRDLLKAMKVRAELQLKNVEKIPAVSAIAMTP